MFDMVKMTRDFHSKGYDKKEEKEEFYKKLNALASPNVYTYYDGVNKKEITVNYNEALFSKAFDIDAYSGGYPFSISGDIRSLPS